MFTQGAWISREELAERARLQRENEAHMAQLREAARAERAARQTEMLLATQTALLQETIRDRERQAAYVSPYAPAYGWPVVVIPGFFPPRCHHGDCNNPPGGGDGGGGHHNRPPGATNRSTFTRVPGSVIPGGDLGGRSSFSPER